VTITLAEDLVEQISAAAREDGIPVLASSRLPPNGSFAYGWAAS
jgi:hypothetical protein